MFWKTIRWSGTVAITLLVIAAALFPSRPDASAVPLDTAVQQNLNFNF